MCTGGEFSTKENWYKNGVTWCMSEADMARLQLLLPRHMAACLQMTPVSPLTPNFGADPEA
jgi:hypothetical protein